MQHRQLTMMLVVFTLIACFSEHASAEDHEGKVVKAGDGKLTMIVKDYKKEQAINVSKHAKITLNGAAAKLDELKAGFSVEVTIHHGWIFKIDARSTADRRVLVPEAVVVSYEKQNLVVKVGNQERSIKIDDHVKVFDAEDHHLTGKQIEEALKKDAKVEISLNGKVHEVRIKK